VTGLRPSRRQVLGGVLGALAVAAGASTGQSGGTDTSGGSTTAFETQTEVAPGLHIGPATGREAIDSATDKLFVGSDQTPPFADASLSGHQVVAQGNNLPAFVATSESDLSTPPSTPAIAVVEQAGVRIATEGSFSSFPDFGNANMTRANSVHVAPSITELPSISDTPAIGVTVDEGPVVFR
jgi:hypothetical protein